MVVALNMLLEPTDVINKVLPASYEPSTDELNNYSVLLRDYDRGFFLDPSQWNPVLQEDGGLKSLLINLNVLLQEEGSAVPTEDKNEGYTDRMVGALMDYLDVGNPLKRQAVLEKNVCLDTKMGTMKYSTQIEFGITLRKFFQHHSGFVFVFIEDKRLAVRAENVVVQHMAENLAFADNNFVGDDPEDQEVFGICVRHRFFTFWHGLFPKAYLQAIRATPAELGDNFARVRCFPTSNYGLDVCDPVERKLIVKSICKIVKYVEQTFS